MMTLGIGANSDSCIKVHPHHRWRPPLGK